MVAVVAAVSIAGCSPQKGDVRGGTEAPEPTAVRHPGQPVDLTSQQAGPESVQDGQHVPPQGLAMPVPPSSNGVNPIQNQEPDAAPTQGAADAKSE